MRDTILALLSSLALAIGQQAPRKLAVSSIHPAEFPSAAFFNGYASLAGECGVLGARIQGNQVVVNAFSLCAYIRDAYNVQPNQIRGMPRELAAVRPENYFTMQLLAEGEAPLSRQDARALLRQALAERFQLVTHWETNKLPQFSLQASGAGHKMSDQLLENCDGPAISQVEAARKVRVLSSCTPDTTMPRLAEQLTLVFEGQPRVVDRTGLAGSFAFLLKWSEEENAPYPEIFTAIQEQLGLKLVAEDVEMDTLVIDRLTYPDEN